LVTFGQNSSAASASGGGYVSRFCQLLRKAAIIGIAAWSLPAAAQVPSTAFQKKVITDKLGRKVTYYVSHPGGPAPLLLMIQGSGCTPVLASENGGSTLYNLGPYADEQRFTVMAVEKPYAESKSNGAGTAQGCSSQFNRDFTASSWLEALRASLTDARKLSWVDTRRTLVMGLSEGAVMASMLAARDPAVTDVISIGGSGTTQLYDLVLGAYDCHDRSACIAEVERQAKAIAAAPESSTQFAWGHPHKRWSSFFKVDPSQELLRSKARVYVLFGTADESVPPASQELIAAKLRSAGRDVVVRRVPDVGHSLLPKNSNDWSELDREMNASLDWFWKWSKP
jgi:pimeloyl-ACP methyl ester carboxylesterase